MNNRSRRQANGRGGDHQSSQKSTRKRKAVSDDEEEDEEEIEPTQVVNKGKKRGRASTASLADQQDYEPSQSQSVSIQISEEEKEKLVGDVVRYILAQDSHKVPVKRIDINNNVLKDYKKEKRLFNYVLDKAKKAFLDVFGYELKELKKGKDVSKGVFILKSVINPKLRAKFIDQQQNTEQQQQRGLLLTILGMIAINNNQLDQDTLYDQLKRLGFMEGEEHPVFGEWEKYIESTLTKQLYLERKKTDQRSKTGKVLYEFRIGARALEEVGRKGIMEYVAETYGEELDAVQLKQLELEDQQDAEEEAAEEEQESQAPQASQRSK